MVNALAKDSNLEVIIRPDLESAEVFSTDLKAKAKVLDVVQQKYAITSKYEVKSKTSAMVSYAFKGCECDYCDCDGCEG
ncbi:MAG: hypothetical protein V1839_03765 [archaeon]